MRSAPYAAALALTILAAACSDGAGDVPDQPASILEPPPYGEGIQVGFDVTIAPGQEAEYCQYVALPAGMTLDVSRFEHAYSAGSHHLLLYQTSLTADQARDDIFPCAGASFVELGIAGIAYAAQVAEGELAFPESTAYRLGGEHVLLLQSHYLNGSERPVDAQIRLNLWQAQGPVEVEAGTLFFYNWAIVVPPNQMSTAQMACDMPGDVELVFAMSHMHRRGVGYRSWVDGAELDEPVELYTTTEWEGVEPRLYQPTQPIGAGQTIHFECDYRGEGRTIVEGPSAEDNEMCMFIAAYYPRQDPLVETCSGPGSGPILDGHQTCGETVTCVQAAEDPVTAEQCVVDTCAGSADPARALMGCLFDHCRVPCDSDDGAACQACMLRECQGQLGTCLSATCEEE
jgi:hypothetical protein